MEKKKNGYQIQGVDGLNAFCEDQFQTFETLEEARSWSEAVFEALDDSRNEGEFIDMANYHIAHYVDDVERGRYALFERIWSVELEATGYTDDTFCSTFDECIAYCEKYQYLIGTDVRLAEINPDDGYCYQIITETMPQKKCERHRHSPKR